MKRIMTILVVLLLLSSNIAFAGGGKNGNPDYYGVPNGDNAPVTNEYQVPQAHGN